MSRTPALIVERLGTANAERLSRIVGGTRLHVPSRIANAKRLNDLLGEDLATLVILHFGDSRLSVPLSQDGPGGARITIDPRRVKRLLARQWSNARIARHLGCSERTIEKKRAALRSRTFDNHSKSGNGKDPQ